MEKELSGREQNGDDLDLVKACDPKRFSGEVHTLVYRPHNGFANYAIATMRIEKGTIKEITLSDAYAGFEANARLEMKNDKLLERMRQGYPANYRHV